jgi:hypothetical protein
MIEKEQKAKEQELKEAGQESELARKLCEAYKQILERKDKADKERKWKEE